MIKRIAALLAVLMIICISAYSEALPSHDGGFLSCACRLEECVCFAQMGDTGYLIEAVRELLNQSGYTLPKRPKATFDDEMLYAVLNYQKDMGIYESGMLDDETLTMLFGTEKYAASYYFPCFYVPVNGGEKLHADAACSGMLHPRMISAENAAYLSVNYGVYYCKHCAKGEL